MTTSFAEAVRGAVLTVVLFLIPVITGCSKKAEPPKGRPPALVVTAVASQKDVAVQLNVIGNMEASESVTVRTQISGELTKVAFREGQDVQKGALLFQLDPRTYQAAFKKAEAVLARDRVIFENAKSNYERYRQLVKEGIVTQEQADGYRTTADSAEAGVVADQTEVENTRAQLSYCTIKAPISGRLGVLSINQGNVVKANDSALVTINKLTPIFATFTIPEKELPNIKRQMAGGKLALNAEVPGSPGETEKGFVAFLDNSVDVATGTIKLKGIFENSLKRFWPGQFVNLSIILGIKNNAVVVPSQAIQTGQNGQFVFVVKPDATADIRQIVSGPVSQGLTVIEKGLQPGEQVVVDGQMRVIPGGKVEVKPPEKPVAPRPGTSVTPTKPEQVGAAGK